MRCRLPLKSRRTDLLALVIALFTASCLRGQQPLAHRRKKVSEVGKTWGQKNGPEGWVQGCLVAIDRQGMLLQAFPVQ